jgi:hypothetical protein
MSVLTACPPRRGNRTADQLPFSSAMMSAVSTTSARRSGGLDAGVSVFATTLSPPMPKQDTIRWLGPPTAIVEERADVGHANRNSAVLGERGELEP